MKFKVGDRVKIEKLHKEDAWFEDIRVASLYKSILIIDSIEPNKFLSGYYCACAHKDSSGEEVIFFYAVKFKPA